MKIDEQWEQLCEPSLCAIKVMKAPRGRIEGKTPLATACPEKGRLESESKVTDASTQTNKNYQ